MRLEKWTTSQTRQYSVHYICTTLFRTMSLIDLRPKFISQGVGKLKLDKKNYHGFGKPNIKSWQILIANQLIAKIMDYDGGEREARYAGETIEQAKNHVGTHRTVVGRPAVRAHVSTPQWAGLCVCVGSAAAHGRHGSGRAGVFFMKSKFY